MKTHLLKGDDSVKRSTKLNSDREVEVVRTTKHPTLGICAHTWTLDYSNVSDSDIIKLATRSVIIDYQRIFRELPEVEAEKMDDCVLDVAELLAPKAKKVKDPAITAKQAWDKMSEEERNEFLAEINKK